jgi:drug/metabolite transporter (DMT)-like permease
MVITVTGVFASVSSAVVWGLYPVLARYLMHRQPGKPPATSVLAITCFWNTVILGSYYAYKKLLQKQKQINIDHKILPIIENKNKDSKINNEEKNKNKKNITNSDTDANADTNADTDNIITSTQKFKIALIYGFLCLLRMTSNMISVYMTKAYLTQMTGMSLPFFTTILASIILNEKINTALYPALFIMILGSITVLYGQGAFHTNDNDDNNDNNFNSNDVYGILLQLISVFLSAMVKIAFKSTEKYNLSTIELLLAQFSVTAIPLIIYSLIFTKESLYYVLYGLEMKGWLALIGISFGIFMFGNFCQIYAVRNIGASNHSASNSIRLVSAVIGSSFILNEYMRGFIGYIGCLMILVAVIFYWYSVHFRKMIAVSVSVSSSSSSSASSSSSSSSAASSSASLVSSTDSSNNVSNNVNIDVGQKMEQQVKQSVAVEIAS